MSYPYELALDAEINRNRVYDIVVSALERAAVEQQMTQAKIAKTIGRKPSQVSTWLAGPSNWTLDTISDLLRAVRASMEYVVVFDVDRAPANLAHPASLEPDPGLSAGQVSASSKQDAIHIRGVEGVRSWPIHLQQGSQLSLPLFVSGTRNTENYMPTQTL